MEWCARSLLQLAADDASPAATAEQVGPGRPLPHHGGALRALLPLLPSGR